MAPLPSAKPAAPAVSPAKGAAPIVPPPVQKPHPAHVAGPAALPQPVRPKPAGTVAVRMFQTVAKPLPEGTKSKSLGVINVSLQGASPTSDRAKALVVAAVAAHGSSHARNVLVNHAVEGGFVAYLPAA